MKIFQIVTVSEYGGAQSVVLNLLDNLALDNDTYLLYGGNGEAWRYLDRRIIKLKISTHRKGLSWKDIFLLFKLFYYRLKYKPDIVHLHSSKMGALGRLAFNPKKIVYTVHGFDSIRTAFRKFLFIEKLFKNRAAKIVAVSQYDVDGLKAEGISKNVLLIYNGQPDYVNCADEDIDKDLQDKLDKIKSGYPKIMMCISRISPQKKFDLYVDIAREMPEYAFVWIGNKEEMTGLPSNLFCLGEAHAAYKYLKCADLFILPSNYEGLPVSILEALSFSIPVIASAVGGITEILDGKNGFAVENNVESFKEKINYSLSDENHTRMSVAARDSYLKNFTIDRMVNGYLSVYREIYGK